MPAVYIRAGIGLVPSELSVCVGVVEGQAISCVVCLLVAGGPLLLVGHSDGLRRNGRSMGPPLFDICFIVFDVPVSNVVLLTREYVYSQDHGVRGVGIYYCTNTITMEIK